MPVVLTKRKLESLKSGQVLEVTTDHASSLDNIERWAKNNGHEVIKKSKSDSGFKIAIRKH